MQQSRAEEAIVEVPPTTTSGKKAKADYPPVQSLWFERCLHTHAWVRCDICAYTGRPVQSVTERNLHRCKRSSSWSKQLISGWRLQSKPDVSTKRDKVFAMHRSRERTAPSTDGSTYSTSQIWPSIRRYIVNPHPVRAHGSFKLLRTHAINRSRARADRVASKNEPRNHHSTFAQLNDPKITPKLCGGSHGKTSGCCQHLIFLFVHAFGCGSVCDMTAGDTKKYCFVAKAPLVN